MAWDSRLMQPRTDEVFKAKFWPSEFEPSRKHLEKKRAELRCLAVLPDFSSSKKSY